MLGLLGLLGAMIAGIMGDSFVNPRGQDDSDTDFPPTEEEAVSPSGSGDLLQEPAPQEPPTAEPEVLAQPEPEAPVTEVPAPEVPAPEMIVPIEELPGEGPVEMPDPTAQLLFGTNDAEALVGGDGNDGLLGSGGADTMMGGAGNDALIGADDEDPDYLYGEDGNDALTLGAGDTATGGAGNDMFSLADFGPNTPPSLIADYSADDDQIVLMYDPAVHPEPLVVTEAIDGTDDVSVMLDGVQIAIVQGGAGLTGADIQLFAA